MIVKVQDERWGRTAVCSLHFLSLVRGPFVNPLKLGKRNYISAQKMANIWDSENIVEV